MSHVKINIGVNNTEQAERLIALLSELQVEGFEEKDDCLEVYIDSASYDKNRVAEILNEQQVRFTESAVEKTNWNKAWESNYDPVLVTHPVTQEPLVHIRASFHPEIPGIPYEILINPKMSFGTGHHATTCLMMEELALADVKGKSVIDFGTGTGILAILAAKMGANSILAIDNDSWSIENSTENGQLNDCGRIRFEPGDRMPGSGQKADIILANINLNVIGDNFESFIKSMNPHGDLIFSGILNSDENKIRALAEKYGIDIIATRHKGEWCLIHCKSTT